MTEMDGDASAMAEKNGGDNKCLNAIVFAVRWLDTVVSFAWVVLLVGYEVLRKTSTGVAHANVGQYKWPGRECGPLDLGGIPVVYDWCHMTNVMLALQVGGHTLHCFARAPAIFMSLIVVVVPLAALASFVVAASSSSPSAADPWQEVARRMNVAGMWIEVDRAFLFVLWWVAFWDFVVPKEQWEEWKTQWSDAYRKVARTEVVKQRNLATPEAEYEDKENLSCSFTKESVRAFLVARVSDLKRRFAERPTAESALVRCALVAMCIATVSATTVYVAFYVVVLYDPMVLLAFFDFEKLGDTSDTACAAETAPFRTSDATCDGRARGECDDGRLFAYNQAIHVVPMLVDWFVLLLSRQYNAEALQSLQQERETCPRTERVKICVFTNVVSAAVLAAYWLSYEPQKYYTSKLAGHESQLAASIVAGMFVGNVVVFGALLDDALK